MSASHQYHQPNAPDSEDDDSASDLELDLNELDPVTSSSTRAPSGSSPSAADPSRGGSDYARRIPLRNLRIGRLRGNRRRHSVDEDAEDLEGLLHDEDEQNKRHSAASSAPGDDDAPLLAPSSAPRRQQKQEGVFHRFGSALRIPGFRSTSAYLEGEGTDPDEDPQAEHDPGSNRTVAVGQTQSKRFPPNAVSNAKYTPWSFLPRTLYNEFSFFFNMYFLLVALSQTIPALRIGYLSTYIAPLAFVLAITLGKEALDDIARRRRDAEANSEPCIVLKFTENTMGPDGPNMNGTGSSGKLRKKLRAARKSGGKVADIADEEDATESPMAQRPTATVTKVVKKSSELKVGDVIALGKDQRVPADVVLLQSTTGEMAGDDKTPDAAEASTDASADLVDAGPSSDSNEPVPVIEGADSPKADAGGEAFIRTDQLDGETDWKLRLALPLSQSLSPAEFTRLRIVAGKPDKRVNDFIGTLELLPKRQAGYDMPNVKWAGKNDEQDSEASKSVPLNIDNTAWANTILASSSTVLAAVVYTGPQTRQALSTSASRSKTGLLENEINSLTKILCFLTLALSLLLVALGRFESRDSRKWYISTMRFLILFSTIVPISLRVNLDMGKTVYAWFIQRDQGIPGTVVRTSTIPEDLGRVEYLLSDKTGTLTQNEMELKKIHVGTVSYANDAMDEVSSYVRQGFSLPNGPDGAESTSLITPSSAFVVASTSATRTRREIGARVRDVVLALALCHSVTPTTEVVDGESITTYQASSPDEIAIIKWVENVGLRLLHRDRNSIVLESTDSSKIVVRVRILNVFPFTSEGKRMGIVVQFSQTTDSASAYNVGPPEIWFFQKGADTVMGSIVAANDWLDEETANMAREGLRTLVVGRKKLSQQQYQEFTTNYSSASLSLQGRDTSMARVVKEYLECDLELLGVTGVEDKLQRDVKPSLELLRNAGIRIWMLTGDKVETARCVAVSSKLVARGQYIHTISKLKRKDLAHTDLNFLQQNPTAVLLIDGESLAIMLAHHRHTFISLAVRLPAVVACRCSPTQKADVAKLIRAYTKKRVCCIGDGGNDVSMIQAADVGVGIVGKEGRQASLAADFSVEQFCYLTKLLVWHGRNSYKRSAKLAQFVIHRGLIISVCQTVYSIAAKGEPIALYRDWLLVGYATVYTMFPVFSLVLDRDVNESLATLYPELYAELTSGRSLSYRTFFIWVLVSIYQGCMIQGLSQILVGVGKGQSPASEGGGEIRPQDPVFGKMVAVSFTVLVLNELGMVAAEITTWHPVMIVTLLLTALAYFGSLPFLGGYFDLKFIVSVGFLWRTALILAIALVPPYAGKLLGRTLRPPSYRKVRGV